MTSTPKDENEYLLERRDMCDFKINEAKEEINKLQENKHQYCDVSFDMSMNFLETKIMYFQHTKLRSEEIYKVLKELEPQKQYKELDFKTKRQFENEGEDCINVIKGIIKKYPLPEFINEKTIISNRPSSKSKKRKV